MTGSDLCASAKPWHLQLETVSVIYEEFYIQVVGEGQPFSPTDSGWMLKRFLVLALDPRPDVKNGIVKYLNNQLSHMPST